MKSDSDVNRLIFTESPEGVILKIHVQPRASRNEICGIHGDELKLRLTAPPVEEAANKLCMEFLAKLLQVAKSRVTITSGLKSRHKAIKVTGINGDTLLSLLKISPGD